MLQPFDLRQVGLSKKTGYSTHDYLCLCTLISATITEKENAVIMSSGLTIIHS